MEKFTMVITFHDCPENGGYVQYVTANNPTSIDLEAAAREAAGSGEWQKDYGTPEECAEEIDRVVAAGWSVAAIFPGHIEPLPGFWA